MKRFWKACYADESNNIISFGRKIETKHKDKQMVLTEYSWVSNHHEALDEEK